MWQTMLSEFRDLIEEQERIEKKYGVRISQVYTPTREIVWSKGDRILKMNRNGEVKQLE